MPPAKLLKTPLFGLDKVIVTASVCSKLASPITSVAKGLVVAESAIDLEVVIPVMVMGATAAVVTTLVRVFVVLNLEVSVAVIVNVVVTVDFGAT